MSRGWIPAHRKIYEPDHWLAPTKRDPSNRRDAWLDLCQMATHTERETANSGTLERGEVVVSVRKASERWCWSKSRVSRFLSDLEDRKAIKGVRGTPDGTVYLIANYDTYAVGEIVERDTSSETEISGTPSEQNAGQAAGHPGNGVSADTPTDSGNGDHTSGTGSGTKTGHRAGQEQECIKHSNKQTEGSSGRSSRLPRDWAPTASHIERAKEVGLDLVKEVEKFRAHAEEKGRKAKSWNGAFTRWLINAEEYARRDGRLKNGKAQSGALDRPRIS